MKWAIRLHALQTLRALVDAPSCQLAVSDTSQIASRVTPCLSDANISVQIAALELLEVLARACGPDFQSHSCALATPILGTLKNKSPKVKQAAIRLLDVLYGQVHTRKVVSTFGIYMIETRCD